MSMKEWIAIDADKLELLDVSDIEIKRVKNVVLSRRKKHSPLRFIALSLIFMLGLTTVTSIAFPTFAAQIPFMSNVINYFVGESNTYKNFEVYSTNIGHVQSSDGITVMIDQAVYDGTNITVSYAIETSEDLGVDIKAKNSMNVAGATGGSGRLKLTKVSETRFVGLSTLTPHFNNNQNPETIKITWKPIAFYSSSQEIKGDWSFAFNLKRLDGHIMLLNETVSQSNIAFTVQSVEFTDLTTIINYEQVVGDEQSVEWESATMPIFEISDNLGNIYNGSAGGGGVSNRDGKYLKGSKTFGKIAAEAKQLIVKPTAIVSLKNGEGLIELDLEPIIIDLE